MLQRNPFLIRCMSRTLSFSVKKLLKHQVQHLRNKQITGSSIKGRVIYALTVVCIYPIYVHNSIGVGFDALLPSLHLCLGLPDYIEYYIQRVVV